MTDQEEEKSWVVRTDFSDDAKWEEVINLIQRPWMDYTAEVRMVIDKEYEK